jgi:hypothetical protein
LVREQLAFALNRLGQSEAAESVLIRLIEQRGPSSETLNLLGRVYKDRWRAAVADAKKFEARHLLDKAVRTYLRGFEVDLRDPYPGVNAVTLMFQSEPPDLRLEKILPVVDYALENHISRGNHDYWEFAALLELAAMAGNKKQAFSAAGEAIAAVREQWAPEATAANLRLIREAREKQHRPEPWIIEIERALSGVRKQS